MNKLKPTLGFWTAVSVVIGSIIGAGIFMKPASMAALLGSPELLIAVWIGAGIMTLFGALSNAELAAMMPETGGQYVFFQKIYGPFFAFLYGWAAFAVFNTAGVASIAYIFSSYTEYFIQLPRLSPVTEKSVDLFIPLIGHIYPFENIGLKGLTILLVMILTLVSYRSTKTGGTLLVVLTFMKIVAIGLVVLLILFSGAGESKNLFQDSTLIHPEGWVLIGAIMAAMSGAFFAYDGWNNITFVAGEIHNPQRNIPRSLFMGICCCIIVYSLVTIAYLYMLPVDRMATSTLVAADAVTLVLGSVGGGLIALLVILSTLGSTHTNILTTSRVTFSMATQGYFFKRIGEVHPKFDTPSNALLLHGIWTSVLILSGSFDMLTDMLVFVSWLFYGMSALGVFILRKKMPLVHRPYKVWGYPFVPAVFVTFTLFYLGMTLFTDITNYYQGKTIFINSVMGLFLTCLGIPLYWYLRKK